jgi:hypothetical protein
MRYLGRVFVCVAGIDIGTESSDDRYQSGKAPLLGPLVIIPSTVLPSSLILLSNHT